MEPITLTMVLQVIKRYWWVVFLVISIVYVLVLRSNIAAKDADIKLKEKTIIELNAEIKSFKAKLEIQNKAIEDLSQKGKEQALRLEVAIAKVNSMKPATQVIIREIYKDNAKDIEQLLLNAVSD